MPKTVLIIEDDKDIRDPMQELLQDEGYSVLCVSTGEEALNHLQANPPPTVIVCDLMMPSMSGSEFIEALKTRSPKLLQRTMILSAATHAEKIAQELGVGFLRKPIDIDTLLTALKKF